MAATTLLVGIGSSHGDDQFGWQVARAVAQRQLDGLEVRLANSPSELLDWLEEADHLILCDACHGLDQPPGAVQQWTWPAAELQHVRWSGTHDLGLSAVLELGQQLDRLPPQVTIWGVQAADTAAGQPMTAEVQAAVLASVERIVANLAR